MKSGLFIISALSLSMTVIAPLEPASADPIVKAEAPNEVAPLTIIASQEVPCDPKRAAAPHHKMRKRHVHHAATGPHKTKVRPKHRRLHRHPVVAAHSHGPRPIRAVAVKPASQRCYVYRRDRLTRASLPLEPERLARAAEPALYDRAPLFNLARAPIGGTLPNAEIPSGGGSGARTSPLSPVGPVGPGGGGTTPPPGGGGTPTPPGGGGTTPPPPGGGGGTPPVTVAAAPEPGSWALMITGVGLAGLALRRRRAQGPAATRSPV